jgi:putative spermidine/putrescine transport system ATP-binding protein
MSGQTAKPEPGPGPRGHHLRIEAVSHAYQGVPALSDVSLDVPPGALVALLGPSGCGKTTLLRIIAGFVRQGAGRVLVDGEPMNDVPAARRQVGIVFQNYALFPHMSVARNVGYGLAAQGRRGRAAEERVAEMLRLVKMERFAARLPGELSGGQQQRVALARALAVDPRIVLLDEPFSALDKALRLDMQIEVKALLKASGVTSIIVTHDQEEALSMADRVVVLNQGRVEQEGTPAEVYDRPESLFVNTFIGHTNLLPATIETADSETLSLRLGGGLALAIPAERRFMRGQSVLVSIRPENLTLAEAGPFPARVRQVLPLGPVDVIEVSLPDGTPAKVTLPHLLGGVRVAPDDHVTLAIRDTAACGVFATPTST